MLSRNGTIVPKVVFRLLSCDNDILHSVSGAPNSGLMAENASPMGWVRPAATSSRPCLMPDTACCRYSREPAKRLHNDFITRGVSASSEFLLDRGFRFLRKLDLHGLLHWEATSGDSTSQRPISRSQAAPPSARAGRPDRCLRGSAATACPGSPAGFQLVLEQPGCGPAARSVVLPAACLPVFPVCQKGGRVNRVESIVSHVQ